MNLSSATMPFPARLKAPLQMDPVLFSIGLALLIGGRLYSNKIFDDVDDWSDGWARLSGWVEMPLGFFGRAEYEYSNGDDVQGQRILLSVGYRL